jgi:hypothetical protein
MDNQSVSGTPKKTRKSKYSPEEREARYKEVQTKWEQEHRENKRKLSKEYAARSRKAYSILTKLWEYKLYEKIEDESIRNEIINLMGFKEIQ